VVSGWNRMSVIPSLTLFFNGLCRLNLEVAARPPGRHFIDSDSPDGERSWPVPNSHLMHVSDGAPAPAPQFPADATLAWLGLSGRVALVTGAASGIGRSVAEILATAGATVVACDRDRPGVEAAVRALSGERHVAESVDVADLSAIEELIARTARRFGRLDILMNVAAVLKRMPYEAVDEIEWRRLMSINLRSQYWLCRAAGEHMKPRGWGRIVNVSSGAGFVAQDTGATAYAITKAGVLTLTKSFARALGPFGICVNTLVPGATETPMLTAGWSESDLAAARARAPLGRLGHPMEIARAGVFLASELSSYISGHALVASGGALMR